MQQQISPQAAGGGHRVAYIDVLKLIGILFIYAGHYTTSAGLLHEFVFKFHVPLFFFLSGCTETFNREKHMGRNIWKKAKRILIPFYLFAVASIVVKGLISGGTVRTVLGYLVLIAKGCVRNTYFAYSLWFLTSLFVVCVLFELLKLLRVRWLMLLCSLALYTLKISGIVVFPKVYNIDYAMQYQLYFVVGYLLFDKINAFLASQRRWHRWAKLISGVFSFVFTGLLFFKFNAYGFLHFSRVTAWYQSALTAMTCIWTFVLIAYMLKDVKLFSDMGKSTLYFCGNEYIVKNAVNQFVLIFAEVSVGSGFAALAFSFVLLLLQHRYLVPAEAKLFSAIDAKIDGFFGRLRPVPKKD